MRSLTEAEARVIRVLLADPPGPERHRIRVAEVPRTTYQTIHHRALVNGWLEERYIPHPRLVGVERVRFILAQPFSERWNDSVRMLRAVPGLVVLWASPESLFGVVFERSISENWNALATHGVFRSAWSVAPRVRDDSIVSYFDYEGAWSRWTLNREPMAYPRGLPGSNPSVAPKSDTDWRAVRELLLRPWAVGQLGSGPSVFKITGLSRRGRKLLSAGWFEHRVVPNLGEIPPAHGYRPDRVVFVTAVPLPGKNPRDLFENLIQMGRATPFVFAYDPERVLFAALSPASPEIVKGRPSMIDLLQDYLSEIEVIREPIGSLFPLVNHRYDTLWTPAPTE